MLEDAAGIRRVVVACDRVDLRVIINKKVPKMSEKIPHFILYRERYRYHFPGLISNLLF